MSNTRRANRRLRRNVEKVVDPIRASLREEALALGIRQDGRAYVAWLKLQRDYGMTGEEAAERLKKWDREFEREQRRGLRRLWPRRGR